MSDNQMETVEPDPAATSLSNDQTVNNADETVTQPEASAASESTTETQTAATCTSENASAPDQNGKDVKVETEGNTANAGEEKTQNDKKESLGDTSKKTTKENYERFGPNDPKNKYRTHGLTNRGNRFDPTIMKETDDPVEIRKQVEFYFSDHNLLRDAFLYDQVGGTKNSPIMIATLHSFKRMRRFQPFEAVVTALKGSKVLEVVDDDKVKRKIPLPEEYKDKSHEDIAQVIEDKSMARSIYAKGFGKELPSTQFDLEALFGAHGDVNAVRLRRADDKSFKGSVFVEFANEEAAQKFLEKNKENKLKFNDRELLIMSKKQYCDDKLQAIKDGKIKPQTQHKFNNRGRNENRNWNERREEDAKNGFRDARGRGRGRGRGGRHDRGGRGGGRGRGGNRDGGRGDHKDRNAEKAEQAKEAKEAAENGTKKRAREDDGDEGRGSKKEKIEA